MTPPAAALPGWDRLRHGGLLLDETRLRQVAADEPAPPSPWLEKELRRQVAQIQDRTLEPSAFIAFVLEELCGFSAGLGTWDRGSGVAGAWARPGVAGDQIKPRHLWRGDFGATLAVFIDREPRLGVGRGARAVSQTLQWLRAGRERLALLTNGTQWRLVFAGLDFDAWCQWDVDLWFEEGALAPQVAALRTLLRPALWTPAKKDQAPALVQAILDSRRGQAELSAVLGERVREAVELLVQAHGDVLKQRCAGVDAADIYRAAVRVVMRLVVVLFAESREQLLPRDNPLYYGAYSLTGLREELDKVAARTGSRLKRSHSAWPRLLALFRLVYDGSHHPDLPVPEYGGELFAPGRPDAADGLTRALAVFESAALSEDLFKDTDVHQMLDLLTKTRVRIRQGRASTWVTMPVDFSDLSSEYIGILYEGLLDFELRIAPEGDPVTFLAVGNEVALPLSRLEGMDDAAIASLFEKLKDRGSAAEGAGEDAGAEGEDDADAEADEIEDEDDQAIAVAVEAAGEEAEPEGEAVADVQFIMRTRAEDWARRAVTAGRLVAKPRGAMTDEKRRRWDEEVARKARQIVAHVVLPGEWYLVRWGGTRKGSGTFYTRPGLAVPTVHRTLRPLVYDPPGGTEGQPRPDAPAPEWTPKKPEEILALKVCDPACGSGTFPVAALRYLTEALYASLHHHGRIAANDAGDRSVIRLLDPSTPSPLVPHSSSLAEELLPCRPDDPTFEPRLKAILRRHVVERCLYGVDLDPLAVELCRLALWIETMDRDLPFSFLDHKIKCGNSLVGAWFDTFGHYPVMAWKNREGGDRSHTNGVHFRREARTKAIKAFVKDRLTPDLQTWIRVSVHKNRQLFGGGDMDAAAAQQAATEVLARLHALPVHASGERARVYRDEVSGSAAYGAIKSAMNLWCACWFWPVAELAAAPLPTTMAAPGERTRAVAADVAAAKRFFHWELEFPDVFNASRSGFDAILGNPPWDIAKPNSKEFFSNIDPLYRSCGKQEAIARQTEYFADPDVEEAWLDYNGDFRAQSSFAGAAASPFGDPGGEVAGSETFAIGRGGVSGDLHARWREARAGARGFADRAHPFRHQGAADLNLYKLFLEQAHALLRDNGRLGFIVPSGLYSDHGTGALRRLFLDRCRWEWLFGFENRDKIFDIHRSFKFNPVIVEKGGRTEAIRTAFMRRRLEDWEAAEPLATPYTRAQVERFSPRSKAILEIQSARDLEILEKIYANSVLLGDDGPDGWGITYSTEFHMTNDSKLFPPRPTWEAQGYRPDEYSRWLKGGWRPIAELWRELKVDPSKVVPIDPECARRIEAPDVQKTDRPGRLRCAQPPYDLLPIPRADIPAGIILSRGADEWIRAEGIEDVALPLYQGVMMGRLEFTSQGWLSGTGLRAKWESIRPPTGSIRPQFLMASADAAQTTHPKVVFRDIARSTDERTCIPSMVPAFPCGNVLGVLRLPRRGATGLAGVLASFSLDWALRQRVGGTHLNWFVVSELPLPVVGVERLGVTDSVARRMSACGVPFATAWLDWGDPVDRATAWRTSWAVAASERVRLLALLECATCAAWRLSSADLSHILRDCDLPSEVIANPGDELGSTGFWRVDAALPPELRVSCLAIVAMQDLAAAGASAESLDGFGSWHLPESVRLADYGLGHDERAKVPQPVASRLGPRFYDWQLAQSVEESWRECEIHAANLRDARTASDEASRADATARSRRAAGNAQPGLLDEDRDD